MTTKRDAKRKQDEPKSAKRPKLNKEKLSDLEVKDKGEGVKGGFRSCGCGM